MKGVERHIQRKAPELRWSDVRHLPHLREVPHGGQTGIRKTPCEIGSRVIPTFGTTFAQGFRNRAQRRCAAVEVESSVEAVSAFGGDFSRPTMSMSPRILRASMFGRGK